MELDKIQKLLGFIDQFRAVYRTTYSAGKPGRDPHRENDAEHTYELIMLVWFLALQYNNKNEKNLDLNRVVMYAIVHDLVEVFAGDTHAFDVEASNTKEVREQASLLKIKQEFSFFPEMFTLIECYEEQNDEESVFVKSVDKILPPLNNLRDNCLSWRSSKKGLTFEQVCEVKEKKIKDPAILSIWYQIKKVVLDNGGFYWLNK